MSLTADPSVLTATVSATVADRLRRDPHVVVGGTAQPPLSGRTLPVLDPATGAEIGTTAAGDRADVDRAVAAAREAFAPSAPWRTMSPIERGKVLHRIGDAILAHADEFTELEVLDAGKVRAAARIEVGLAAECFHYFSGWPSTIVGSTVATSVPGAHVRTEKDPVGVVGAITAWNFPLVLCGWKLAPALAAGCTVVLKPSEETPHSALWLAELATDAGLPPGVLNVVPGLGTDAGQALVEHAGVDKITFTGSTAVGTSIARSAAEQVKRVTLELGGKSANIICADADLDAAVAGSAAGIFGNAGQTCSAPSRLFVAREVHDRVVDGLRAIADSLRPGHGLDDATQLGPLINAKQFDRVSGHVRLAAEQGATVHRGGDVPDHGFFHPATVISDARDDMTCAREEIFGPVLTVLPFDTLDEVLRRADDSEYGLAAGIWTTDVTTAARATKALRDGTIYVNGWGPIDPAVPFGGFRRSGYGRDLGPQSLEGYLETKAVWTFHG